MKEKYCNWSAKYQQFEMSFEDTSTSEQPKSMKEIGRILCILFSLLFSKSMMQTTNKKLYT